MSNLACQTDNRCHDFSCQHPAQEYRQCQAEHEAHHHDREQHPLALLEIALVLQQNIAPPIHYLDHGVVGQLLAKHFMKSGRQVTQVLGQLEFVSPAAVVEQLVGPRPVAPVVDAVHA
ncbi:hypothetical protein D3C80_1853390 [compost metagenome]